MEITMLEGAKWITVDVPDEVLAAAKTVGDYFDDNYIKYWQLTGICDRRFAHLLQDITAKLNTTINDH